MEVGDADEICANYRADQVATFQQLTPGDYFILVRSDLRSRCVHRSALTQADSRIASEGGYLCEWVAPASHPDALSDPRFNTGKYYDAERQTYALLQPEIPETHFYPIVLSETTQGVGSAYFTQTNFDRIKAKVRDNPESVQVFYLGDGTSVRMGNCQGDFDEGATHGQRDIAFVYPIVYHRQITPDRIEFLTGNTSGEVSTDTDTDTETEAEIESLHETKKRLGNAIIQITRDRSLSTAEIRSNIRKINREKTLNALQLEWLETVSHESPDSEQVAMFRRRGIREYHNIQQRITDMEADHEPYEQHHEVLTLWAPFFTRIGVTESDIQSGSLSPTTES